MDVVEECGESTSRAFFEERLLYLLLCFPQSSAMIDRASRRRHMIVQMALGREVACIGN